jgi:glutamate N-acetyltransferase/amino-acid N-acetyltransferase
MLVQTTHVRQIDGGITAAKGFRAAGLHCGIKAARKRDLALVLSDGLASLAAMFTTNKVKAAPVLVSQERTQSGVAQAIIISSGNANACTGAQGLADAREMTALVARALGIADEFVLVASTGIIGTPLPMGAIRQGIPRLVEVLGTDGTEAAEAILTTDAFPKTAAVQVDIDGTTVTVGGMTKGAGMIHPQMATTLTFITTDAAIDTPWLRSALRTAVNQSYNCISVDGDTSTNDSIFVLANGRAGNAPITEEGETFAHFQAALNLVTTTLAKQIVRDGEGASKVLTVTVRGARTPQDAKAAVTAISTSLLVKTALAGSDPNWGRIMAALGRSGAMLQEDRVAISIGAVPVVRGGIGIPSSLPAAASAMSNPEAELVVELNLGSASHTGWTSDLNESYVKFNSKYTT